MVLRLKVATGFRNRPIDQVEQALENDLFDVVAIINNEVVGLTAAEGKETFYERFGFNKSNGMNLYIEN